MNAQTNFDRAAREARRKVQRASRIRVIALGVLIPTVISFLYYLLIARPEYRSVAQFTIQGLQQAGPDLLTGIGVPAASGATKDGLVVVEYAESPEMVARLRESYGFDQAFGGFTLDPWGGVARDAPLESATKFWATQHSLEYDSASNIVSVYVHAFRPEDSLNLAKGVLAETGKLINSLNSRVQNEALRVAQSELAAKEADYRQARQRITQVRANTNITLESETSQEVGLVGSLESQIAATRVEQAALAATYRPDSPQMVAVNERLRGLEQQRARAQSQVESGPGVRNAARDIQGQAALLEYEFAQKAYYAALTALEGVSSNRNNERRYIVSFVPPRLPQISNYWSRFNNVFAVAIASALLISLATLITSVIKDHMR